MLVCTAGEGVRLNSFEFLFLLLLLKHIVRQHTGLSESRVPSLSQ